MLDQTLNFKWQSSPISTTTPKINFKKSYQDLLTLEDADTKKSKKRREPREKIPNDFFLQTLTGDTSMISHTTHDVSQLSTTKNKKKS